MDIIQQKGSDEVFCQSCRAVIKKEAELCVQCGVATKTKDIWIAMNIRWIVSILLCVFLGIFGAHRFYNRKIFTGIILVLLIVAGYLGIMITSAVIGESGFKYVFPKSAIQIGSIVSFIISFSLFFAGVIWLKIDTALLIVGKFKTSNNELIKMKP